MTAASSHSTVPVTAPALGPERLVAWPHRTIRTLANGMQVVLAEQHTFPKIGVELFFRSGNALVSRQSPGLAELTSRVVRTGTASRTSRQIEEDLRRVGASLGTTAGADTSAIAISGLSEFAGKLLAMVDDLARNASFPADEFERERRQRLEELRIERATPSFLANERFRRVLFSLPAGAGEHPYAIVAPTEEQVEAYQRDALVAFYRENYVPSNALLIAVGDFASDQMMALVEKTFGAWKAGPAPALAETVLPVARGRAVHLVHLPGTVQTEILLGNLAITRQSPDWRRTVLANAIYGGAFNSRLVANIREQKGYTYSPRSALHSLRHHGYFSVHAAVRNDVVAATLTEMFYELDRLRSLPVSEGELADAINYLSGVFSLGIATQDGLLAQLSTVYLNALPEDYLETFREKVRALQPEDVLAAARRHFDSANAQIVIVGDRAQAEPQAVLFGDVKVWDTHGHALAG
ncbi:MAG TPA: pitrilysin family protein [Candidatus Acidoferrales bacterium]|nr:pitrilysin family protein [Candidatus Acidoferrales bacterium]